MEKNGSTNRIYCYNKIDDAKHTYLHCQKWEEVHHLLDADFWEKLDYCIDFCLQYFIVQKGQV